MIPRTLAESLKSRFFSGKALIVLGPRQVGKTTLIREILSGRDHLFLNGDDPDNRRLLTEIGTSGLRSVIGKYKIVFIDEAQRIPEIGLTLKLITDQFKDVQLIVSGSSALEINQRTQEPLTGRKFEYQLFPVSWEEFEGFAGFPESEAQLEERLIYGMYPDVITHRHNAAEILKQLTASYLFKDILALASVRKPDLLERLLRALALQIGNEVSLNELSGLLGVDKVTVDRYIDLLEQAFIVFRLNSFGRNLRKEIKFNRKIYFRDNGVRNTLINNLNPVSLRSDKGALWENFLISERLKIQGNHHLLASNYFWRTVHGQEIDFVEESGGKIRAFEFKWSGARARISKSFLETYSAEGKVIDRQNFREFVNATDWPTPAH